MSDAELVGRLVELLREERRLTAAVLAHLGEVEARRLYLPAACSSMFVYCTRVLGMSEDQAFKRIQAARAMRRFPVVATAVAEGRLHLTAVVRLAPHLEDENVDALVAEASGKRKAEIDVLLARLAPKAVVPPRLERVVGQQVLVPEPPDAEVGPEPARPAGGTGRVQPIAPARFALQLTIGEATQQKLLRALAVVRHQVPSGDLAELLDLALDALLDRLEGRKFGKTRAPRPARTCSHGRYVPREVRRQAVARDGIQCAFVAEDGRRCEETGFLELDHRLPVARGGAGTADNVRMLCRAHNQFEAERILGRESVEAGRAARQMETDLVAGLKRLGVSAVDARQAVTSSRGSGTIDARMRAALAALHTIYTARQGTRCSEPTREYHPMIRGVAARSRRGRGRSAGRGVEKGDLGADRLRLAVAQIRRVAPGPHAIDQAAVPALVAGPTIELDAGGDARSSRQSLMMAKTR
jgi:hypothetical protein